MRSIQILAALLLLSGSRASAQLTPTYDAVAKGISCTRTQRTSAQSQRDCEYRVGKGLIFVISAVGETDAAITVTKASGYDSDYYATFGTAQGCVAVKPGTQAVRAALRSKVRPDNAFVSPKTGSVYTTLQECRRAR